jgi:hypothetical protein
VALRICKAVIKDKKFIDSGRTVDQLIDFIKPLLADDEAGGKEESFEFEDGQYSVARMLHLFKHSSHTDIYYDLLNKFKRAFAKGGKTRQKHTYPSLIFSYIRLSALVNSRESQNLPNEEIKYDDDEDAEPMPTVKVEQKKIFKTIAELITVL